jgi:hypothetical protein
MLFLLFFLFLLPLGESISSVPCPNNPCIFGNNFLRFGNGRETSVNSAGLLQQPFYYLSSWRKLTYSSHPLDTHIGTGTSSSYWFRASTVNYYSLPGSLVTDYSQYVRGSGNYGYGTVVTEKATTINGYPVVLQNTYTIGRDTNYMRCSSRVTNSGSSTIPNVWLFAGTRDDWVGSTDRPNKIRGNVGTNGFQMISSSGARSSALQVVSTSEGVLFFSDTEGQVSTTFSNWGDLSNAYRLNPTTLRTQTGLNNDGSYAIGFEIGDLGVGEYKSLTWYYAAGGYVYSPSHNTYQITDSSGNVVADQIEEEVQTVCPATQVANSNKASTGSISGSLGASVQVICNAGYYGGGSADCVGDGVWSATLTCVYVNCGTPSRTGYTYSGSSQGYGATRTASCAYGYEGSSSTVTCQSNGQWSSPSSSCTMLGCGEPSQTGYNFASGGFTYRSTRAVSSCATGYTGSGSTITCQIDEQWTTSTGCNRVSCGTPSQTGYNFLGGSTVYQGSQRATCAAGFQGSASSITCGSNGQWSLSGGCERVSCGNPSQTGYVFSGGSSVFEAVQTSSCASGFEGAGSSVECRADRSWTTASGCTRVDCGTPSQTGYNFLGGSTVYQGSQSATCAEGYAGSASSITCGSNGQWSLSGGCERASCGNPSQTGYVFSGGRDVFEAVQTSSCASGFEGTGSSVECRVDLTWTTASGCTRVDCGAPVQDNYEFSGDSTVYEATQSGSCAAGWIGSPSDIACQADATWTASSGCERAPCGSPSETLPNSQLEGFVFSGESSVFESVQTASCASGFEGAGSSVECLVDQTWTAASGCARVDCGAPVQDNYEFSGDSTVYEATQSGSCAAGWIGSPSDIACQADATWTVSSGCERAPCVDPEQEGYVFSGESAVFESVQTASCGTGFEGAGSSVECLADGSWSAASGCARVDCGAPVQATYEFFGDSTVYESQQTASCSAGYEGTPSAIVCQYDATWTSSTGCAKKDCGAPVFEGYLFEGDSTLFEATQFSECLEGYVGVAVVECTAGATWSEPAGCSLVDCGYPSPEFITGEGIGYELDNFNATTYGGVANISCAAGYEGAGIVATCLVTGDWEAVGEECVLVGSSYAPPTTTLVESSVVEEEASDLFNGAQQVVTSFALMLALAAF